MKTPIDIHHLVGKTIVKADWNCDYDGLVLEIDDGTTVYIDVKAHYGDVDLMLTYEHRVTWEQDG